MLDTGYSQSVLLLGSGEASSIASTIDTLCDRLPVSSRKAIGAEKRWIESLPGFGEQEVPIGKPSSSKYHTAQCHGERSRTEPFRFGHLTRLLFLLLLSWNFAGRSLTTIDIIGGSKCDWWFPTKITGPASSRAGLDVVLDNQSLMK